MPPIVFSHARMNINLSCIVVYQGKPDSVSFIRMFKGNPDILICGNCREMFTDLSELLEHKRDYCKLRFTCKCLTFNGATPSTYYPTSHVPPTQKKKNFFQFWVVRSKFL